MEERSAYTSGGVQFLTADGKSRAIPAGACSITPQVKPVRYLVRWQEGGSTCSAEISADAMAKYLRGCIVQYA